MPPKRKIARNNKKKKGAHAKDKNTTAANSNINNNNNAHSLSSSNPLLPKNLTDGTNTTPNENDGAHYQQYKQATAAFWNGLRSFLPESFPLTKVNDLVRASIYIYDASVDVKEVIHNCREQYQSSGAEDDDNDDDDRDNLLNAIDNLSEEEQTKFKHVLVPHHIMANLETSIELRSVVTNMYRCEGNNDSGHTHMIRVLRHCQKLLKGCRAMTRDVRRVLKLVLWRKKNSKVDGNHRTRWKKEQHGVDAGDYGDDIHDNDRFHNRFAAFAHVFDGEEEEEEESEPDSDVEAIIQERKVGIDSSPVTDETDVYTIEQDLIKGSDRLQACCFLHTMERLMGLVSHHYHVLKVDVTASKCSDPKMLMQCAMVANTCMYSVQRAEAALAIDYPYITSFYCVLAVVYLPSVLAVFEEDVLSSASEAVRRKCDKAAMIMFLGEVVECSFQNKGNMGRYNDLVRKFSKKTGVVHTEVERIANCAKFLTDLEIQSACEKEFEENKRVQSMFRQTGINQESHQWLLAHTYIGGKRSILSTLRWLQTVIHISNETKLMSIPGFFGTLWDEERNTASSIQGDLDELFCGSILPELLEWCKTRNLPHQRRRANSYVAISHSSMLDAISPHTPQTLPILDMLRKHMKENKDGPVPISLAFGMHCILTSIIEMQGHGDVARHASNAEKSWNALFQSLETHKMDSDVPNHHNFFTNVGRFTTLNALPTTVGEPSTQVSAKMAFFNPLMAGSYLLFANYVIGLGLGSCTVDSIGQLRFVLHLYNAFQKTGLLDDVPLLKEADAVFKDTQAVWVLNDHPDRGDFCKRFLLAWGYNPKAAAKAIKAISSGINKGMSERPQNDCRNLKPILPEEMSASYRLVMNRDFTGVVDDYSLKNYDMITPDQKKEHEVYLNTISNINMTRDRMDEDEDSKVSLTNWTQVGCIFNEFIRALMKEFGWDRVVQQLIWKCPDNVRHGQRSNGSRTHGQFEVSDVNLEYQAYSQIIYSQILHPIDQDPNCTIGKQCADFMKKYFATIDEKTYSFFIDDAPHSSPSSTSKSKDSPTIEELQAMSVSKLKKMAKELQLDLSECFEKRDIVELLVSGATCLNSNVEIDDYDRYIRGTRVPKSTPEGANPLDMDIHYPHESNGTPNAPFQAFSMYKYTKTKEAKVRIVKPGKLTPIGHLGDCPYDHAKSPQLVPLSIGKYRHIGSFSLKELRQIGWDGAMYNSVSVGTWVPLVDGYESDNSDRYEPFDQRKARRERIIGLPVEDIEKYMLIHDIDESGEPSLVQLRK